MCQGKIVSLYWWRISSKTSYLETTAFDVVLQKNCESLEDYMKRK